MTFDRITRDKAYLSFKEFEGHFCLVTRKKKKKRNFHQCKKKKDVIGKVQNKKDEEKRDKRQRISLCNYYFKNI
jgi:hypothetical protein